MSTQCCTADKLGDISEGIWILHIRNK